MHRSAKTYEGWINCSTSYRTVIPRSLEFFGYFSDLSVHNFKTIFVMLSCHLGRPETSGKTA